MTLAITFFAEKIMRSFSLRFLMQRGLATVENTFAGTGMDISTQQKKSNALFSRERMTTRLTNNVGASRCCNSLLGCRT